ncbi:Carbohydrate kinase, FGGY family [hydrothermal vent metagenome]|uniref:Carbohydrate kinase, FGGY family n=1 Tax=hydrothermal vent metagenome TaxID=652676 RepID=A0A3B0X8L9_9ZZZZ
MADAAFLGIDIGTSGIRASCINSDAVEILTHHIAFNAQLPVQGKNEQDPKTWLQLLDKLLLEISTKLQRLKYQYQHQYHIKSIAIDGTSSTLLACKKDGTPLSPALMYNDQQSLKQAETISHFAPSKSAVHGASSSLAKALNLLEKHPNTEFFCHQADWLAASLTGTYGISDENNCLKLGYDSIKQQWPDWLHNNSENAVIPKTLLPQVIAPGQFIANVKADLIKKYQLAEDCAIVAGTTDSNAAVLATGANKIGDAVTSLGSTLVIKVFSDKPIFNPEYGIYSHRLNNHWLVGGASNSGGAVLLQHFTAAQLDEMTAQLNPEQTTDLDYYPLPATGERFPENNSNKKNITSPRPKSDVTFFQGLLEGIASIEANAYRKLEQLGVALPKRIFTSGGGSKNLAWKKIREQATGIKILNATHSEACYGSALLAKKNYKKGS